jgi:hypothetical protein
MSREKNSLTFSIRKVRIYPLVPRVSGESRMNVSGCVLVFLIALLGLCLIFPAHVA